MYIAKATVTVNTLHSHLIYWWKHFDSCNAYMYLWHPWQVLQITGSIEIPDFNYLTSTAGALVVYPINIYYSATVGVPDCSSTHFTHLDLLPNSLYRAVGFANFEVIWGFSVPSILWVGAGLMNVTMFVHAHPAWPTKIKLRMTMVVVMISGIWSKHCSILASDRNIRKLRKINEAN